MALNNPPYEPLDILLSYSHYTLQNRAFELFCPHFLERAKVEQLVIASPFSMGLLTSKTPKWHPAPQELLKVKEDALGLCEDWEGGLPDLALGFSLREGEDKMREIPRVVGLSSLQEVHAAIKAWRQVRDGQDTKRLEKENAVKNIFKNVGLEGYSWQSP